MSRRGGAPRKAPGGLTAVLFVRCGRDLLDDLDALARRAREAHPGRGVSRADVARELLYRELALTRGRAPVQPVA